MEINTDVMNMKKKIGVTLMSLVFLCACEEVLFEEDISGNTVTVVAPLEGAQVEGTTVQFNWRSVEGATNYEIQVATPSFDNANQIMANAVTDSTLYQAQLTANTYEWRVKAMNSGYETQYNTVAFTVVDVDDFSNNIVNLLSPADGLITNAPNLDLQWEGVTGATQYRVQVTENGAVNTEETTSETSLQLAFPEGNLSWQVRAENDTQNTLYSERSVLVDRTNPNVPMLTAPEDEAVLTSQDVSFSWTRELIAGSVEFDSLYVYRNMALTDLVLKEEVTDPFETNLENNTYYWLMKAFDEAGNESDTSSTFSFTVDD